MDFKRLPYATLKQYKSKLEKEIQKRQRVVKRELRRKLLAMVSAEGFTIDDIFGEKAKHQFMSSKLPNKRKPAKIKYRHPNNQTLTWSGRGKKPLWVTEWLNQGNNIESLAVSI